MCFSMCYRIGIRLVPGRYPTGIRLLSGCYPANIMPNENLSECQGELQAQDGNESAKKIEIDIGDGYKAIEENCTEIGILEQADTTSVENLSIVTVVEKDLEILQDTSQYTNNLDDINGYGK